MQFGIRPGIAFAFLTRDLNGSQDRFAKNVMFFYWMGVANMHCRELLDLAAMLAVHSRALLRAQGISPSGLELYWSVSKLRLQRWTRSLQEFLQTQTHGEAAQVRAWQVARPLVEEVLATEVLTRVWTSIVCVRENLEESSHIGPIVRSVYQGHLEARNRGLNVLVYGRGFSTAESAEVNRLRRRCERWCDLLLGYVLGGIQGSNPPTTSENPLVDSLNEFAFEPARMRDFARDASQETLPLAGQLVMASLRNAFVSELASSTSNPKLNRQVASSILACFEGDLFDATGPMQALWLERIHLRTNDAEEMIEELIALER